MKALHNLIGNQSDVNQKHNKKFHKIITQFYS